MARFARKSIPPASANNAPTVSTIAKPSRLPMVDKQAPDSAVTICTSRSTGCAHNLLANAGTMRKLTA